MLKAVFFDLDGTLLPMDEGKFTKYYFYLLYQKIKDFGYNDFNKLVKVIWEGTSAMMKNDGSKTNYDAFWNVFEEYYGKVDDKTMDVFDDFYRNDFKGTKETCEDNKLAKDIVEFCKKEVGKVILSTNPIFPKVGTETRLSFLDMKWDDFDFVTAYENSSYAKPNPKYFAWLLEKFNFKPEEVILFGNNDYEDFWCAKQVGIDCYLVGEHLIIHPDKNIECPKIRMDEVVSIIKLEKEKRMG